jgi:hypothetical protein
MRASIFRPTFDRLDARIVLDASVATAAVATTVVVAATPDPADSAGDDTAVPTSGWYQGGTDPLDPSDPEDCTVPVTYS